MRVMVIMLLALLTVWAYRPALSAGFVYEDVPSYASAAGFWSLGTGRWLSTASRVLETRLGGGARLAHTDNLALHLLNGVLLLGVAGQLLTQRWAAVLAVAVFWLHPINVEAVAYVTSRAELLLTMCLLAGAWLVLAQPDFTETPTVEWGLAGLLVLAAGTKEIGAVAFLSLIALVRHLDGWPRPRWMEAVCGAVAVIGWQTLRNPATWATMSRGFLGHLAFESAALWRLLRLVVWPVGFSIEHDIVGVSAAWALWSLAALGVSAAWAWRARSEPWAVGVLWALVLVAPRLLVPFPEGLHEHHLYGAMAGLSLSVGALAEGIAC